MAIYTHDPDHKYIFTTKRHGSFIVQGAASCTSGRMLSSPSGTCTILFKGLHWEIDGKTLEIDRTLDLYDLCEIKIRDGEGKEHTDVYGFITEIRPSVSESSGVPEKNTSMTITSLGQALVDYQVFWHPHIAGKNNLGGIGFLARSKGKVPGGRPDQVLRQLIDTFFNDDYIFTLRDGRKISQSFRLKFEEIKDSLATLGLSAMGAEGPLWSTLKRYSDAPWCELFVDTARPGDVGLEDRTAEVLAGAVGTQETVHLRRTPFRFKDWDRLAAPGSGWGFSFDDSERMGSGENLLRTIDGVSNFFWTPAKALMSGFDQLSTLYTQSGEVLPLYLESEIRSFGLRRLEQGTEYAQYFSDQHEKQGKTTPEERIRMSSQYPTINDLVFVRSIELMQWFGYPNFYRGSITLRGRIGTDHKHGARIGGILTRNRDGMQFYIDGIQQNWSFPGPHTTTLTVSRGHIPKDYRAWFSEALKQKKISKGIPPGRELDPVIAPSGTNTGIG